MAKPNLTREEAIGNIPNDIPEKVILLGIRGYYKRTMGNPEMNDRNIYDDAIFLISPDNFSAWNANTDPSKFRKGIATLKAGIHYYRKGNHGISKPGGGYPALRPATRGEKLPVTRDGAGDDFGIAINIHKGSINSTSSEGCQTIKPDQWSDFINEVYGEMDRYKQDKIPYVLVEQ
jgi:lysozyme